MGAKRAEAIVQLRTRLGRFQRVEDLMRVRGIGRKMCDSSHS
ncbi:MAG: helix-hairpin-helix domain-containing protein [Polyangiaceae bacterium]|nr:helix-hairpin-helix domain-containing protein [Polyangiaceae bacterium]